MIILAFFISLSAIIIMVTVFKSHPFLALIIGALLMGFLSGFSPADLIEDILDGFGNTMKEIGILILLGVILGELLHNSGATRNIADKFLKLLGVENAPLALNITGYLICIPVFFDAAFVILIDLVKQISKEGKIAFNTLICALTVGMTMTHAMVIPTPGPLAVAGIVGASVSWFIFYSLIISLPASLIAGVLYGKYLKKHPAWGNIAENEEYALNDSSVVRERDQKSAGGTIGVFLILLPLALIITGTIIQMSIPASNNLYPYIVFFSNTNIILLGTVFLAFFILRKYLTLPFNEIVGSATESVGPILAIIGAGGSFGNVISKSGLGNYLVSVLRSRGIPLIVLAFILTQILRIGLGSITVSLVTSAAVIAPMISAVGASPVLVGLAVCAGGIGLCMPNDSSFWMINRFCGFNFGETACVLTVSGTIAGFTSFAIIMILNQFVSVLPGLH